MANGEGNGTNGWRDLARFQIAQSEAKLAALEQKLLGVDGGMATMRVEQAEMKGEIGSLRTDIVKATQQLEEGRRNDLQSLQQSIKDAQQSSRAVLAYLIAPIIVIVVAGLIVFALTGSPGH